MTRHTARPESNERASVPAPSKVLGMLAGAAAVLSLTSVAPPSAFSDSIPFEAPSCQGETPTIYRGTFRSVNDTKIEGTEGDDVIVVVDLSNEIHGRGGDDVICTFGDETNQISGGTGNDRIVAEGGNDTIFGGDGDDEIHSGAGADQIYGDHGNDTLHGDGGNDWIKGNDEDDKMYGGGGNDHLRGRDGRDEGFGGPGGDLCRFGTETRDSCGTWTRK